VLGALLLNRIGNTAGRKKVVEEAKAQIALEGLREDFFKEQDLLDKIREEQQAKATIEPNIGPYIYKIPKIELPAETATAGDSVDDELALLLILAEL